MLISNFNNYFSCYFSIFHLKALVLSAVIFNFLHITREKELADSHWEPKHSLCDQSCKHAGSYIACKSNVTSFIYKKFPCSGWCWDITWQSTF